ncbi:UPF0676 protein [Neolecta irregularis DAH-3]|uniref:UPF0676 protein n=1 Tax=Neolecta irregularis (strain DAH-3) TaxID=1198029 RepID=A0A1U7LPX6_NEOID|nr:UPF0676 protein [Neolecta irregularis DAH-3]|eukprot:OLL24707.1 UPF0676 protein [Neolecta irregularis DAH-3]
MLTTSDFSIPVIDFGPFLSSDDSTQNAVADQVIDGFTKAGFIYLVGQDIVPSDLQQRVFDLSAEFFARPIEEKQEFAWSTPKANRGYVSLGREKTSTLTDRDAIKKLRKSTPDLKESFEIGNESDPEYENHWPKGDDDRFKKTMIKMFHACYVLELQVLSSIALGLGLPKNFFSAYCDEKVNNLRLLHYPSVPSSVFEKTNQTRANAHCDYGLITLLFQDDQGGLEIQSPSGEYVPAKPIAGSIIVNAGDLLARWCNDRIKSTLHRVTSPPIKNGQDTTPARYSVAYFTSTNRDVDIEVLDV